MRALCLNHETIAPRYVVVIARPYLPESKIWVVWGRPELVSGHKEENEGGGLLEDVVQPLVLVRSRDLQQVDDDSGLQKKLVN